MPNSEKVNTNRNYEVDFLRGFSIILMVIFHFGYDLIVFGWADFSTTQDVEWQVFRIVIVTGFLLTVGMSSYLAYNSSINIKKVTKATCKLFAVSLFITLSSLMIYPNNWVYFGIIHFITVALLISILFVQRLYSPE